MNEEQKDTQIELYRAFTIKEILERREMFGNSSSLDSLSGGFSIG